MAEFSKGIRKFWNNVAMREFGTIDGKPPDLRLVYSESKGFHFSGLPADEVHHVLPGSMAEAMGRNPNSVVGLPVSRLGHRGSGALPFDQKYSFHPDMEKAARDYANGDKSAFKKAQAKHKEMAQNGLPIPGFDPDLALELEEMMLSAAVKYIAETGEKKPVSTKVMPKRKHWSDDVFDY